MGYESISDVGAVNFIILGDDDNVVQLLNESLLIQEDGMWLTHNLNRGDPAKVFTLQHLVVLYQAEEGGLLRISVSTDGGKTFSDPQTFTLKKAVDDALTVQWLNIHGRDIRILFELPGVPGGSDEPFMTKLLDPPTPGGEFHFTDDGDWDPSGTYLAVGTTTNPGFAWYRRDGDELTKLTNPDPGPTWYGSADQMRCGWDETGTYLAIGSIGELALFKRDGDTLTKVHYRDWYEELEDYPNWDDYFRVLWHGDFIITAQWAFFNGSTDSWESGLNVWKRTGDTIAHHQRVSIPLDDYHYGEHYFDASLHPSRYTYPRLTEHPDDYVLAVVGKEAWTGEGIIRFLDWNPSTGLLSLRADEPWVMQEYETYRGVSWDYTGNYIAVGIDDWRNPASDYSGIRFIKRDNGGFVDLDRPFMPEHVYVLRWHPCLPYLAAPVLPRPVAMDDGPWLAMFHRNGDELIRLDDPEQPTGFTEIDGINRNTWEVAWTDSGSHLAVMHRRGNNLSLYAGELCLYSPLVILKHHIPYITERSSSIRRRG